LGPTQPFYVLEPYRFDGLPMPPTFEAMAAAHLEALRSVQPVGPYLLGGFCNGGLIAYEMARQLHTQGEQVELLVLIDPASPASHCWLRSILRHLSTLLHLGPQQQFAWFLHVLHVYKYLRLAQYRQRWHDLGGDSEPEESQGRSATAGLGLGRLAWLVPSVEAIRRNWLNVYEWVTADYVPGSYPGKIMVFWSSEGSASMQRMGWRQVLRRIGWTKMVEANEVEVQVIPGTHITWRTEHYRTLAEQLQMCLNKAQVATLSQ
jgi:pimeloyl-ACP methyl ester carboxylesterase